MKFKYIENNLLEMARLGYFDDYEIFVFTNDSGKIPHFHIRDSNTMGQKFHTCIRIDKAEYFHHTGKEDILNKKERKELVNFLNSKYRNRDNETNWSHLVDLWNDNNSDIELDDNTNMPDYINIKEN